MLCALMTGALGIAVLISLLFTMGRHKARRRSARWLRDLEKR